MEIVRRGKYPGEYVRGKNVQGKCPDVCFLAYLLEASTDLSENFR